MFCYFAIDEVSYVFLGVHLLIRQMQFFHEKDYSKECLQIPYGSVRSIAKSTLTSISEIAEVYVVNNIFHNTVNLNNWQTLVEDWCKGLIVLQLS